MPPVLKVCPESLAGSMSGQTLGVFLSFDVPMATDNSGDEPTVVKTPNDIDSPYNFTRDTVVSYNFSDGAGNSIVCSFNVNIEGMFSKIIQPGRFGMAGHIKILPWTNYCSNKVFFRRK